VPDGRPLIPPFSLAGSSCAEHASRTASGPVEDFEAVPERWTGPSFRAQDRIPRSCVPWLFELYYELVFERDNPLDEQPEKHLGDGFADGFAVWIAALAETADPDQIAAGYQLRERLNAVLTAAVGRLDTQCGFVLDGALTTAAWLRHRVHLDSAEASRTVRIARRLPDCPVTENAWQAGDLTGGQVAAIVDTIGTDETLATAYAEREPEVLALIAARNVRHATFLLHRWRDVIRREHPDPPPAPEPARSKVTLSSHLEGQWRLDGNLDPTTGNLVETALNTAIDDLPAPDHDPDPGSDHCPFTSRAEQRADALALICQFYLDHRTTKNPPRNRPHVNVIVDLAWLARHAEGRAETIAGVPLDRAGIDQLLCDANIHRIVMDGPSVILDQGRGTRHPTPEQWNALVARDRHCTWPAGCHAPPSRCHAHHEPSWLDGGTTDIAAMRLLCSGHHRLRHQPGWTAKILPDATYEITNPHGKTFSSKPRC
jgi:Domain of unknown function (DUF222)